MLAFHGLNGRLRENTSPVSRSKIARTLSRTCSNRVSAWVPETRFFDYALDLLAVGGFDGRLRRVNPAWTDTLGWSLEELLASPYANLFHPDDLANNLDGAVLVGDLPRKADPGQRPGGGQAPGHSPDEFCAPGSPPTLAGVFPLGRPADRDGGVQGLQECRRADDR